MKVLLPVISSFFRGRGGGADGDFYVDEGMYIIEHYLVKMRNFLHQPCSIFNLRPDRFSTGDEAVRS